MLEHIKIIIQYLLPKRCLTVFAGFLARRQLGFFTTWMITLFVKLYRIDMQEAQTPDVESFSTFNAFFTRHLKEGARPIEAIENTLCFPADGVISQLGKINGDQLIQAKGHEYSLDALLACNTLLVEQFTSGYFITIYLSPKDYHRVHMPCAGTLREMIYVPGALFSVNHATARHIPDLFARNERVICVFDTEFGKMVQILVGATIVGSISTAWHGEVTPPRQGVLQRWVYPAEGEKAIHLAKGEEMGFFQLGSTVINLFPKDTVRFSDELMPLMVTRMGEYFADEEIKFKSESAQVNE